MNKFLFFLLFIAVSLSYVFEIDKLIAKNLNPFNNIKEFYIKNSEALQNGIDRYFNQASTIKKLQEKTTELQNYKLLFETTIKELNHFLKAVKTPNSTTTQIKFTRVLSYVDFDNFTKVWLDMKKEDNKILGVISDGYAAGIVVNDNGKAKALLNGNEKANYSIFIGDNKAPGIIHGEKNKQYIVAKFVPIWYDIKVGDEVITSGMDNIFFEGLKVGKVVSIKKQQDMQEALIEPYAKVLKQKYFFVYSRKLVEKDIKKHDQTLVKEKIK